MPPKSGLSKFKPTMKTRGGNKTSHPGQVINDAKQKRRSPGEMIKVRAEETRLRQEKETEAAESIQLAANIEDQMRKEDINRGSSNRHGTGQAPFCPPAADNGQQAKDIGPLTVYQEPKATDPDLEDKNSSGEEYAPPTYSDNGESEVEDQESDLDGEVEGAEPKKSRKGKKPKPARADIKAKRHFAPASLPSTAHIEAKRKAHNSDGLDLSRRLESKKKKVNRMNSKGSALLPGWNANDKSELRTQDTGEDDSMVRHGGFVADNETDEMERKSLLDFKGGKKKTFLNNIKISESKPMVQSTKRAQCGGASKWTLNHLPSGTSALFTDSLVPLAKIKVGTLDAWDGLSPDQIQHIVDTIYPEEGHIVEDDDVWGGLIGYRLSNWRNGFYMHARDAVKKFFETSEEIHVEGKDDIAEYVGLFTEIQGNPPTAPFHWREWNVDEETGNVTKKGRLQNELIMYTLAHAHFSEYEDIPDPHDLDPSELPGGALILAMQAVEHAFKFWKTGEFVEDKSSHFSADNYGDTVKRKTGPDGRLKDVKVLNAGQYKPTIRSLTVDKHWVPIFEAVTHILSSIRKKKARSKSASSRASLEMIVDETLEYILVSDED